MSVRETRGLVHEHALLQKLQHPNIAKAMGYFSHQVKQHIHHFLVLERVEDGVSLLEKITSSTSYCERDVG